jgi:Holliday junction DNA helicase RuvB
MGVEWGREVGCKIRFSDQTTRATVIKFLTDGMLLAEVQSDPMLRAYSVLILDEAHERSLNIDFLLGYLVGLLQKRPDLKLLVTSGPALDNASDLTSILVTLYAPTVVFVDEIHQLPRAVEETLYTALEDARLDVFIGEAGTPRRRAISVDLEPFTLIGATTRAGALGAPFRDRFGYIGRLTPYDVSDLSTIVAHNATLLDINVDSDGAAVIASRSRGTPRIANRLLRRVRDWAHSSGVEQVGGADAAEALATFGVDQLGLDAADRALLHALCADFGGGPVGVSTLAAIVGENAQTVEELCEPHLMRIGLLARTPRGRVATRAAFTHLNLDLPAHMAQELDM